MEDVLIVDPVDGEFVGVVEFDEVIHRVVRTSKSHFSAILMPAFVDPHVHGIRGVDTMYASRREFDAFREYEALEGVWYFLPTTVTTPLPNIPHGELPDDMQLHIEGPFISRERRGAHNEKYLTAPTPELFTYVPPKKVALVTVAPELEGFDEFAETCGRFGVKVSLGHSNASFQRATEVFQRGFRRLTHFPNAMSPLHHRELGLVGAGLSLDFVVEIIPDGVHTSPEFVRLVYKVKGADRIILVTDSISATGLSDGEYLLGDLRVRVRDGKAQLEDGTIAGSTLRFSQAVKNFSKFTGCSLVELAKVTSYNACLDLGLKAGRVASGYPAKLVLLDRELNILKTYF